MKNNNAVNHPIIIFIVGLQLIFITLKLTSFIAWPWLLVMSPCVIWIFSILLLLIVIGTLTVVQHKRKN